MVKDDNIPKIAKLTYMVKIYKLISSWNATPGPIPKCKNN